jgi:DNA (cytosine-5)-methyltransferase 1
MVATESVQGGTPEEFKKNFIENIYKKNKFRRITAQEAARLQGFPPEFRLHKKETVAHKQFGNAVSVPVVYNVIKSIMETGILE